MELFFFVIILGSSCNFRLLQQVFQISSGSNLDLRPLAPKDFSRLIMMIMVVIMKDNKGGKVMTIFKGVWGPGANQVACFLPFLESSDDYDH